MQPTKPQRSENPLIHNLALTLADLGLVEFFENSCALLSVPEFQLCARFPLSGQTAYEQQAGFLLERVEGDTPFFLELFLALEGIKQGLSVDFVKEV